MSQLTELINGYITDNEERAVKTEERSDAIDERFEQVDERFRQIDERFRQVDFRFDRVEARLERLEDDFRDLSKKQDRTLEILDGIADRLDVDDSERVAASAQTNRHEDWIEEAAPVVGIPYHAGA
ncbi:hypothetical protein [Microbacterium sorbitolivorans]|uniref:hypothetical protein n=1 Tax=Microbacterium sorbitolivorans TaxID=1867410 RepID=UPI0013B058BA|nr:hypothetical protein [Microbacterium sorbitolivorans]